ncbi:MAG: NADH-quinone oxidoreductase subunit A [Deltaproteobacteria bacterium]|nr:NADH-quinone oxidoreductase subunit A [Deltaproteobacteria bacterium]
MALNLFVSSLIRPNNPNEQKETVYDCGELPVGPGFTQFNMRFYLVAFVFVIFDVEIAFMYPVTVIFKDMVNSGWGILAFVEIALFIIILLVGFIYAWSQGGLEWAKSIKSQFEKTQDT